MRVSRVRTDAKGYREHDSCASDLVLFEAFDVRLGRKEACEMGEKNNENS